MVGIALIGLIMSSVLAELPAAAWKPFTHNYIGTKVWEEITQTGAVTFQTPNGSHSYPVDARIVNALKKWPSYYNAGVIGPDGFPDLLYGQAVVHPMRTGLWLRYLYQRGWAAQNDPQYSAAEKEQILAFTYGFMIHGASDMWGHTLINSFASGVFPDIGRIVGDLLNGDRTRFNIALRHIVSEAYIGNATPGWDSFEGDDLVPADCFDQTTVQIGPVDVICNAGTPNESRLELGPVCNAAEAQNPPAGTSCLVADPLQHGQLVMDVSENSTPGVPLDSPNRFLQNVMVSRLAPTPFNGCADGVDYNGDGIVYEGCEGGVFAMSSAGVAAGWWTPPANIQPNPSGPLGENVFIDSTRGPAIDSFLDLQAHLQLTSALYSGTDLPLDCVPSNTPVEKCVIEPQTIDLTTPVSTERGIVSHTQVTHSVCKYGPCIPDPNNLTRPLMAAYMASWANDITDGLRHWSDFSLAVTRGLFDPQTRRDAENHNHKCSDAGFANDLSPIASVPRTSCEAGTSLLDSVFYSVDKTGFTNDHLIPMLSGSEFFGDLRHLATEVVDALDALFEQLGIANPITQVVANTSEFAKSAFEDLLQKGWGIDFTALEKFMKEPAAWMCGDATSTATVTLNGQVFRPSGLFTGADHARLDAYMGMPAGHHVENPTVPPDCAPLSDAAKFDEQHFAAFYDSVQMSKLLFLTGNELNQVMADALVDAGVIKDAGVVRTYSNSTNFDSSTNNGVYPANIMIDTLKPSGGADSGQSDLWLQLIDGDHAWRHDGLPVFCNTSGPNSCSALPADMSGANPAYAAPIPRSPENPATSDKDANGGAGTFPMWASCLLRPAFRGIFHDWENSGNATQTNFPDLGDPTMHDASVPDAPRSTATVSGTTYSAKGITYIGADNHFTVTGSDAVFTSSALDLQYQVSPQGSSGAFHPIANGGSFNIPSGSGDGPWSVGSRAQSPCFAFGQTPERRDGYTLDTTAPSISINQPTATTFTHAQTITLDYSIDDGAGSGVKTVVAALDGLSAIGGHGLQSGQTIDLTQLSIGPHTFTIVAEDNLGNASVQSVTFTIAVTPDSIKDDVTQAFNSGQLKNGGLENSLLAKLNAAASQRASGDCATASATYQAFINELTAQSGKGVDPAAAALMIADARYLMSHCP